MQPLTYFLTAIIACTGLFIGIFLALQVKEELKKGNAYFKLLGKVLFAAIFAITLNSLNITILIRVAAYIAVLIILSATKLNSLPIFSALGAMFYITSAKPEMFFIVSSMIFIFGLAAGGELAAESKRKKLNELILQGSKTGIAFAAIAISLGILL